MAVVNTSKLDRNSFFEQNTCMFDQKNDSIESGKYIGPICKPVIYKSTWIEIGTCSYMGFNILFDVRWFTPCSIPIIHKNTLWLHNSLILF